MRKFIAAGGAVALAVMLGLATAGPAAATLEYVSGGKWYHQYTTQIIESNYYHSSRVHRSSVTTTYNYVNSGWKSAGVWSYANDYPAPGGAGNRCNYDLK